MMRFFLVFFYTSCLLGGEIHEKVLICGVCRNVATKLEKTKAIMESIGLLFDDYRILVYENNSTDATAENLLSWAKTNSKVWVKSENLSRGELENLIINVNRDGSLFVPEQIARARNIVMQEALTSAYEEFPYLIWMDMDFVRPPDLEGFRDTFSGEKEWDAVFAYGVAPDNVYWDWYAHRDLRFPFGPELLGTAWYAAHEERQVCLTKESPWYLVYSAFGGCGIYRKSSIQGCRYSALVTPDLELCVKRLLEQKQHPQVHKYWALNKNLSGIYCIEQEKPFLPPIASPETGIVLHGGPDPLIWRMNTFTYQYPSLCEHVPFHASMIVRGHDKLYINPKLVFRYGD